jgi:hypothetical protein
LPKTKVKASLFPPPSYSTQAVVTSSTGQDKDIEGIQVRRKKILLLFVKICLHERFQGLQ